MITEEAFWSQIGRFNDTFRLLHYGWMVASGLLVVLIFLRPGKSAGRALKLFLSATFFFNGLVFFGLYTSSPISRFFYGPLFVVIGLFLLMDASSHTTLFRLPDSTWLKRVTLLWLVLVYAYPLFGVLLGRSYPYLCMPMNPCPSTVLATTLIVAAMPFIDKKSLISLIPWGLLGLPKAVGAYGCYEDSILFLSGLYGLTMLIVNRKSIGKERVISVPAEPRSRGLRS